MTLAARVKLEDVARAAGVSKSIASRILNGYADLAVRPQTRKRVLAAARALDPPRDVVIEARPRVVARMSTMAPGQ